MKRHDLRRLLVRLDACYEAQNWVRVTPGGPKELWYACPRGEWLLWGAWKARAIDRWSAADMACREFATLALESARVPNWPKHLRDMPQIVDIPTAMAARDLCRQARVSIYAAHVDAYAPDAVYAANAAYDIAVAAANTAAFAVVDAAATAAAAADKDAYRAYSCAIYAATYADAAATGDADAWAEIRRKIAKIVRDRIQWSDVERGIEEMKL